MNKDLTSDDFLESHMKAMLLNHLRHKGKISDEDTLINEFTLDNFSRRADITVVYDEKIICFEIKSRNDSLRRLQGQVETYLEYFDKVVVFSDKKHIEKILQIVPKKVEVLELNHKKITIRQRGRTQKITNKKNLLKIMTLNELHKLARENKFKLLHKKRTEIEENLLQLSLNVIRLSTIRALKSRFKLTSMLFWQEVGDEITASDIKRLSRSSPKTLTNKKNKNKNFKSVLEELIEKKH